MEPGQRRSIVYGSAPTVHVHHRAYAWIFAASIVGDRRGDYLIPALKELLAAWNPALFGVRVRFLASRYSGNSVCVENGIAKNRLTLLLWGRGAPILPVLVMSLPLFVFALHRVEFLLLFVIQKRADLVVGRLVDLHHLGSAILLRE